jgi:FecR protein
MLRKWVVCIGAVVLGYAPAVAAGKIGVVVAVVGNPSASGPSGARGLSKDSEVFEDDTIKVSTGNAQIILDDGTRIVVGPSSSLLLDQFVMRGKTKAEKVTLKALRGTYRFITGSSPKTAYKISTAHGTIGIRGTAFDVWSREKTGAVVLRGRVNLKSQSGGSVDIKSGCQMGVATKSAAAPLRGKAKNDSIKMNLPFILDQSSLTRRFRLDVVTCRLSTPTTEGGNAQPELRENNDGRDIQ